MKATRTRLMLLGNRRIAWEVLVRLAEAPYREAFDVVVLVSDEAIADHYRALRPDADFIFIGCERRQSQAIRDAIDARQVDVLLSVQYNWILPADILEMIGGRAFNLHNARLPAYKGFNSVSHAIANGDTQYTSTLHWMEREVDAGDIAYEAKTRILPDDTAVSLYLRTIGAAVAAVCRLLDDISAGSPVPRRPMASETGTFYERRSISELADVTGDVNAETLARLARAAYFPPYNTAFFRHAGQTYLLVPQGAAAVLLEGGKLVNQPQFPDGKETS